MKNNILYQQRNTSLDNVLDTYAAVFEGKAGIMANIQSFKSNNARINELLGLLARPRTAIFRSRRSKAINLRQLTRQIAGMGLNLATAQKDKAKLDTFTELQNNASRVTYWQLWQVAVQVQTEMNKEEDAALSGVGLTIELRTEFADMIEGFHSSMTDTQQEMQQRKSAREELDSLQAANHALMRYSLDPFINLVQKAHADLYRDYKIARRSPLPGKTAAKASVEVLAEVSGVVLNASDNTPVTGATIMIRDLNLNVSTDEDGYYLLSDVPAGSFKVSCYARGYKVPADSPLTVTENSNMELDFVLEADDEQAAA